MISGTARTLGVIALAAIAATIAWGAFRLAGVDFELKDNASQDTVRGLDIVLSTVVAGGIAFGVYSFMESRGWSRWWPVLGSTVIAVSMIGPSYYADGSTAVALMVLHLIVGAVLIGGFAVLGVRDCAPPETRYQREHGARQGQPR